MKRLSRREWFASLPGGAALGCRSRRPPTSELPTPTPAQLAWQDFEVGLVFHFDLPVFAPGGWSALRKTLDPNLYQPRKLDTDQWLAAARAAGARYAVFTATHFNGFLQWQSDLYPYGLKQTRWRHGQADVFGDFVNSCRRHGIAPGVYLSVNRNAYWKVWDHRVNWGQGGRGQREFAHVGEGMTRELCSRYGPLCEIWYDAGTLAPSDGGPDVLPIVDRYQPNIVFYSSPQRRDHRWIGNERGVAGYPCWATMPPRKLSDQAHHYNESAHPRPLRALLAHGDPDGPRWEPAMVDVPIRNHEWFWRPHQADRLFPLERLVEIYYTSVGRNSNLILGATPNRDGLVPEADFRRYAEFGQEIRRRFSHPVAETAGGGAVVELKLPRPTPIDHVVLMEEIADGERIRAYEVEGHVRADRWRRLCAGSSVGHKRIERFQPVEVAAVRLRCTRYRATPEIRRLAVFATGAT